MSLPFRKKSVAEAQKVLLTLKQGELDKIRRNLDVADAHYHGKKEMKVQAILSAVNYQGGPYQLLNAMEKVDVHAYLKGKWNLIKRLNIPKDGDNWDTNYNNYSIRTCQHFILWAWAYM